MTITRVSDLGTFDNQVGFHGTPTCNVMDVTKFILYKQDTDDDGNVTAAYYRHKETSQEYPAEAIVRRTIRSGVLSLAMTISWYVKVSDDVAETVHYEKCESVLIQKTPAPIFKDGTAFANAIQTLGYFAYRNNGSDWDYTASPLVLANYGIADVLTTPETAEWSDLV